MDAVVSLTDATGWGLADVLALPVEDVPYWIRAVVKHAKRKK